MHVGELLRSHGHNLCTVTYNITICMFVYTPVRHFAVDSYIRCKRRRLQRVDIRLLSIVHVACQCAVLKFTHTHMHKC